jgi:tetratricopeptide (TPR) repeat protein
MIQAAGKFRSLSVLATLTVLSGGAPGFAPGLAVAADEPPRRLPAGTPRAEAWIPDSLAPWVEGIALLHTTRVGRAVDWFEAKQREDPGDPCTHYFLALAYEEFRLGQDEGKPTWEELIGAGLEAAEALDSADPGVRYCEGALYGLRAENRVQRGKYLGAAYDGKRFRRIMLDLKEEYPDFVDALFWIGTYEYAADVLPGHIKFFKTLLFLPGGNRDTGFEMLEQVAEQGILDRFSAHFVLAAFYDEQERDEDRQRILEDLARRYPRFPWGRIMLAWSYTDADPPDFERALALHEQAVAGVEARQDEDLGDTLRDTRLSLARLYQGALEHRRALELIEPVYAEVQGDEAQEIPAAFLLVRSLNRTGQHERAVEVLRGVEQRYPDDEKLDLLRIEAGLFDAATGRVYEAALPARVLAREGRTEEAEAAFRVLLQRYPDHPEIHFRMAEMYFDERRYPRAEAHMLRALAGDPALPAYVVPYGRLQLGQICDVTGRRSEARQHYRAAVEAAGEFDWLRNTARGYLKHPYAEAED